MPDDTTIPLDIAVAGSEAIAHYQAQVAALVALGDRAEDASASVLDQWETIHSPHLRVTSTTTAEKTVSMTSLATLRLRLATLQRNYTYVDSHGNTHAVAQDSKGHWISNEVVGHEMVVMQPTKAGKLNASIHATSARLQQTHGLPPEISPGSPLKPVQKVDGHYIDPNALPDPSFLTQLYGEHALGAALHEYSGPVIKATAKAQGIPLGATKDETISRLTNVATQGRYSANFGTVAEPAPAKASPSVAKPGDLRLAKLQLRALAAEMAHKAEQQAHGETKKQLAQLQREHAKLQVEHARLTATKATAKTATAKPAKDFQTHLESQLLTLNDASDPREAQQKFGSGDALYQVLRREPEGALELMLQHANMPPGPAPRGHTANVLARNIVQRLEATKAVQQETKITPIARIAGREINPAAVPDPVFLRTLYGDDQLAAVLGRYKHAQLKEVFTLPAFRDLKPGKTIAATRQILMQRARELPLMPHTPFVPTSA